MFKLPSLNRYWPIGLDLGADSVKMLQLRRVAGEILVSACSQWRVPAEVRQDPKRRDEMIVSAVKEMLKKEGFRGKKVVSSLSCNQLGIKNVRLPHLPAHEMIEAIRWEANERFSFPVDSDRLKCLRAGEVRHGADTQDEIIMLAATEETVNAHLAMLDAIGLKAQHIEAEPVALFRVMERFLRRQADRETVSVMLDIGYEGTRIVVARGRHIVFIKSIDIGGRKLTDAVARQLNLSFEEAAEVRQMIIRQQLDAANDSQSSSAKKGVSESVNWTVLDALRSELQVLAKEIALCLRYCSVTFRGLHPKRITTTGGEAYDPAVLKLLSEQLGIECDVGQPLRGINVSGANFAANRRGLLPEWSLCAGLAMRDIDPYEDVQDIDHGQRRLSA